LKKTIILSVCLLLAINFLSAQTVTLEGVERASLRGSGAFIQNDEVAGYYFFYGLKRKKGKRPYILEIYDQDMNKTATEEMLSKPSLYLEQAAFDGENMIFKFFDNFASEDIYATYNQQAEFLNLVKRPAYGYGGITGNSVNVSGNPNTLFAVPEGGFLSYTDQAGRKPGYMIEYFDSKGQEVWQYASDLKSKHREAAGLMTLNDRVAVNLVGKSLQPNGRKMSYSLSVLHLQTGAELLNLDIKNDQYSITLVNGEIDEENGDILLFGEYYPLNAKQLKTPSLGLFTARINTDGELSNEKYISWKEDVSKFIPVDNQGRQTGKGFTWFHKIIKTDDGRIFAIGEQFRQVVDGAAVAGEVAVGLIAALLGGGYIPGGDVMKMVTDDMVIYEFSPEFELTNVSVIEKDKISFNLPGDSDYTTRMMGRFIEAYGLFGYTYTKMGADGNSFSIGFTDHAYEESKQKKTFFKTLTYQDSKYTENKIEIGNSRATRSVIYPAKDGHIMIAEYFKPEKQIVGRLEKISE